MVCNICGKNEATIHLTEILNNQMVEIHLCEMCAEEKGTDLKSAQLNFGQLLANLSGLFPEAKAQRVQKVVCKGCGMSFDEFAKIGRLGCGMCYQSFEKQLAPLLKRIQKGLQHVGKVPQKIEGKVKSAYTLRDLQARLQKAVQNENYEEAAQLRDQIRLLEENLKKDNKKPKN